MGLLNIFNNDSESEVVIGKERLNIEGLASRYNELLAEFDKVNNAYEDGKKKITELQAKLAAAKDPQNNSIFLQLLDKYNQLQREFHESKEKIAQLANSNNEETLEFKIDGRVYDQAQIKEVVNNYYKLQEKLTGMLDQLNSFQKRNTLLESQLQQNEEEKHDLANQLSSAKEKVAMLEGQLAQMRQIKEQTSTENDEPIISTGDPKHDLIDRYYQLVQTVLSEYQDQLSELQAKLTNSLIDSGETEFLKLIKIDMSASAYQKMLTDRNTKMIRYVENHGCQEKFVNKNDKEKNVDDNLRGIRYWANFVFLYRKMVKRLLKMNRNMTAEYKYACSYGKDKAMKIRDQKPPFLDENSALKLQTIYSGIKDYEKWKEEIDSFHKKARIFLKGVEGENLVKNVVASYENNHVLTSLNLPYQYRKGEINSNQVDSIVVNRKGIFILEVKNYSTGILGINKDGRIINDYDKKGSNSKNIIYQGQNHYRAVCDALTKHPELKKHMGYLKKQIHVLYVSANSATKLLPAPYDGNSHYHFVNLEGLRQNIDNARGNLHPDIIRDICSALVNAQQEEKSYPYYCFPANPDEVADKAWKQFEIISDLVELKLDNFVNLKDSRILSELDSAGFRSCDGFVTHKPKENN